MNEETRPSLWNISAVEDVLGTEPGRTSEEVLPHSQAWEGHRAKRGELRCDKRIGLVVEPTVASFDCGGRESAALHERLKRQLQPGPKRGEDLLD